MNGSSVQVQLVLVKVIVSEGQDWLTRNPSQEVCDSEQKKLLVHMLDGIADHSPDDADSVFSSPQCQDSLAKPCSIRRIIKCHEDSPYLLPLPSNSIISSRTVHIYFLSL